ncbi:MAG: hypothetical protein ACPLPT_10055 [Moorellales bacterium]
MLGSGGPTHRLLEKDLDFIVRTVADRRSDPERVKEIVRDKDDLIEIMLNDPKLLTRIREREEELLVISPYLLFNLLLRQVRRRLKDRPYTLERRGRERVAVFDAGRVAEVLSDSFYLEYVAETLASFTRVQTGVVFYRAGEQWKQFRFNSLEVDDLIFLAGLLPREERFPVYRRLGDLCLFLVGIFPDYRASRARSRLASADYHWLGPQYYSLAAEHSQAESLGLTERLQGLAKNFALLVKALNFLAEEYIGSRREQWFVG